MTDARHPCKVTADRLGQHRRDFHALLTAEERAAMAAVELKLRKLAGVGARPRKAWRAS
jgi:hypothetical protein